MLGDAVHNLRCALDYAWMETLKCSAPSAIGGSTKFPVRDTADELKAALQGAKIHALSPGLFDLVVLKIKPYKEGGNFAVWPVHRLNNTDKHKLLVPLIQYSGVTGIDVEDETGNASPNGFTMGTTQAFPYYVNLPTGWRVKKEGKVSISIIFDSAKIGGEFRTADCPRVFSRLILEIIEVLERFCEEP